MRSFVTNIKRHLIGGLIGWLTGALSEVAITLPENFDVQGVFSLVMQILGLTYENIKAKVIKRFPPAATVFAVVEKGFTIVKRLVTEGPMALWEEAKAALSNLKEIVLDGIRGFVITTVIKEAITWLLGLLNPAGALVKILKLIFDFVMFLVERFEQIKDFVMSVYNAVTAIASGALGQAQAAVEDAMARSLPVAIGLLASLAGLGGIGKTVKGIIGNVAKPVHKVVDKVIAKIIKFVKKPLKKGKAAAAKAKDKVLGLIQWWKQSFVFKSKDGGSHKVYYKGSGTQAQLMVASGEDKVQSFLASKESQAEDAIQKKAIKTAQTAYGKVRASEERIKKAEAKKKQAKTPAAKETANTSIKSENAILKDNLGAFANTLGALDFAGESDMLVKTVVTPTSGAMASSVDANPLTYLPGNTVGSPPKQDPPGWSHAVNIDTDPATSKRRFHWVRGHLLNENLHGPGETWNMVPITQKTNSDMKNSVEQAAKKAIATKGNVINYRAEVTFYPGSPPINDFPQQILVTWGKLERIAGSSPPKFKPEAGTQKSRSFTQDAPPATPGNIQYNINTIGRDVLVEQIGISHRFGLLVTAERKNGNFDNYNSFEQRMTQNQSSEMTDAALFQSHLQKVKTAADKGLIVF